MKLAAIIVTLAMALTACEAGAVVAQPRSDFIADFEAVVAQPPSAYGTNLWWSDEDATLWASRWAELEPSLVRVPVFHAMIEPVNDNDDPEVINWDGFFLDTPIGIPGTARTVNHGTLFRALRDQPDLSILIYFPYLAPWLADNAPHPGFPLNIAPHPPNDLAEYREFVETVLHYLVATLGFPPKRIVVEAMNEPDLGCGVDSAVPCFWSNWTTADIAGVVRVTYEAIQTVDANIPLVGLAECCGTGIVRDLLDNHPEGAYLERLSYHHYSPTGYNLDTALAHAAELAPYGLPVYLDEYGSYQFLSEGAGGGLWHSWALTTLWKAGIAPLQFPISEFPWQSERYNSMGLFADWRGDWARKPSYWVYTNFFSLVAGGEIISHTAPSGVDVLAARRVATGEVRATFWVVNRASQTLPDQSFVVHNFPREEATLYAYDNLVGPTPALTKTISSLPLVFTATLPAHSSRAFVLRGEHRHDSIDHIVLAPSSATLTAGQAISYTLTAYDDHDNDWDVTASGAYTISPDAGGSWTGNVYTSEAAGTWTVTGSYSGQSDSASLVVDNTSLVHVSLTPETAHLLTGQSISYTLTAYNAYGDEWSVTTSGTYTIEPGAGGDWAGNRYTSERVGTWIVTGTYGDQSDPGILAVWLPQNYAYLPLILLESRLL